MMKNKENKMKLPKPAELKAPLLRNRIGQTLQFLENALVGETIKFYYSGGSGSDWRTVLVLSIDIEKEMIFGLTKERFGVYDTGLRTYKDSKSSRRTIVEPFVAETPAKRSKEVRFDAAGAELLANLPAETLAELYQKHVVKDTTVQVGYDKTTGNIVLEEEEPSFQVDKTSFCINSGNKALSVFLYPEGNDIGLMMVENGKTVCDTTDITPKEFAETLRKFLE